MVTAFTRLVDRAHPLRPAGAGAVATLPLAAAGGIGSARGVAAVRAVPPAAEIVRELVDGAPALLADKEKA